ncbi:MAG: hypothetical protein HN742_17250, partial [Lentisphaerae bacterium]|nr:hypothetical protein [Lentisphaerota bacterium]
LDGTDWGETVDWVADWVSASSNDTVIGVKVDDDAVIPLGEKEDREDGFVSVSSVHVTVAELVADHEEIWWFNGGEATKYIKETTVRLVGPDTGSCVWTYEGPVVKTSETDRTIVLKSKGPPPATKDNVTVTATYGGKTWTTHLTVRMPWVENELNVTDHSWIVGGRQGYVSNHLLEIRDQLAKVLPHNVEYNEVWGASLPYYPNNWPPISPESGMFYPAADVDYLGRLAGSNSFPTTTTPDVPPALKVVGFHGDHYIGPTASGKGVWGFGREWVYYTNHARRQEY